MVLTVIALYLPLVATLAVQSGIALDLLSTYVLVIVFLGVLAASPKVAPPVQHTLAVGALLTANVTVIETSGKVAAAQLGFVLVSALVTLYRSWALLGFSMGYIAFYYLGLGRVAPDLIFPPGLSYEYSQMWAGAFFLAALLACIPGVAAWLLEAPANTEAQALKAALEKAALRERQAAQINDTVVQDLVTALYATDMAEPQQARASITRALEAARGIVDSLISPASGGALVRDEPAQESQLHDKAQGVDGD